jgi:hypothetical protein
MSSPVFSQPPTTTGWFTLLDFASVSIEAPPMTATATISVPTVDD